MAVKKKSKPKTKNTKTKKTTSKIKKTTVAKKTVKKVSAPKKSKPESKPRKSPKAKKINKPKAKITKKKTAKPKKVQLDFSSGDFIVYPTHGVGEVTSIQIFEVAGEKLEMYEVFFEKDRMTQKIPTSKAKENGTRKVSSKATLKRTLEILNGKAKVRRTMWSRRAQEYEAKINSGNLSELTEVVRDLFRNSSQPEQSYSERQLYESARDRLAREVAVVEKTDDEKAVEKIEVILNEATKKSSSENISL
ncbi:MAG: CarD family transcriptional regulator [Alphaproteobacteria bacterium]